MGLDKGHMDQDWARRDHNRAAKPKIFSTFQRATYHLGFRKSMGTVVVKTKLSHGLGKTRPYKEKKNTNTKPTYTKMCCYSLGNRMGLSDKLRIQF